MSINPNNILWDILSPLCEKNLDNRAAQLSTIIIAYINKNIQSLQISGPSKRLYFAESDKDIIYMISGITKEQVKAAIKSCTLIQKNWVILNDPFNILITIFIIHYILKKNTKMVQLCNTYLLLKFYSSIQYKYARYGFNEDIMTYTINNLSNKFKIKHFRSIFDTLVDTTTICFSTHESKLRGKSDMAIKNWIMALNTRINGIIQKIKDAYEKNKAKGAYMNTEEDINDEDTFRTANNNNSMHIERLTNALTNYALSRPVVDNIIRMCAKACDVSYNETKVCIQNIIENKQADLHTLFNLIFQLFLMDGRHTAAEVKSKIFISEALTIYKSSNTHDPSIIEIKDLLDKWLKEVSITYQRTQRLATKNNLRRAVFMYFIFFIYQYDI